MGVFYNIDTLRSVVSAMLAGVFIYALNMFFPVERIYTLFLYSFIGLVLYMLFLNLSGGLSKEDKTLIFNTIDPRKMYSYIRKEVLYKDKDHEKTEVEK